MRKAVNTIDLEVLRPKRRRGGLAVERKISETEDLKEFFFGGESERVRRIGLAKVLNVSNCTITNWFRLGIPASRLADVTAIKEKIQAWESRAGKRFGRLIKENN